MDNPRSSQVSQSVRLGVEPTVDLRPDINSVWNLLYFLYSLSYFHSPRHLHGVVLSSAQGQLYLLFGPSILLQRYKTDGSDGVIK
jgi:hypothetical protein